MRALEAILDSYNLRWASKSDGECSHIVLAMPYAPYRPLGDGYGMIDSYYIAGNKLYHLAGEIKATLISEGYQVIDNHVLLKPLGESVGIGKILFNQLLVSNQTGSKMTLQAITIEGNFDKRLDDCPTDICKSCRKCDSACPTGALNNGSFDRVKCLRHIQDYQEIISENMGNRVLGCDECQRCCPHNAGIEMVDVPSDLRELLRIDNLATMLNGGRKALAPLSEYIGSNYAREKYLARILKNTTKDEY